MKKLNCFECGELFNTEDLRIMPKAYLNNINLSSHLDREKYHGKILCSGCYCMMQKLENDGSEWEDFPKVDQQMDNNISNARKTSTAILTPCCLEFEMATIDIFKDRKTEHICNKCGQSVYIECLDNELTIYTNNMLRRAPFIQRIINMNKREDKITCEITYNCGGFVNPMFSLELVKYIDFKTAIQDLENNLVRTTNNLNNLNNGKVV